MKDTLTPLPPLITQAFNPKLLSFSYPKLRDHLGTFDQMWKEALKLWKRLDRLPDKKVRCEKLKEEILDLYERAKIKEKEREGQTDHKTQKFGYHVAVPKGLAEDVFARLKLGRKDGSFRHASRRYSSIQKTYKKRTRLGMHPLCR